MALLGLLGRRGFRVKLVLLVLLGRPVPLALPARRVQRPLSLGLPVLPGLLALPAPRGQLDRLARRVRHRQ